MFRFINKERFTYEQLLMIGNSCALNGELAIAIKIFNV